MDVASVARHGVSKIVSGPAVYVHEHAHDLGEGALEFRFEIFEVFALSGELLREIGFELRISTKGSVSCLDLLTRVRGEEVVDDIVLDVLGLVIGYAMG